MTDYDAIATFYDAMYCDRKKDIVFYVDRARKCHGSILECGCGTGRILIPIAKAGREIWGIDSSKAMLDIARLKTERLPAGQRGNLHLVRQSMCDFNLGRTFDLCLVPFRAFLHMLTPEDQNKTLRRIHRHLQDKGTLILDIFAPSYEMMAQKKSTLQIEEKLNPQTGSRFTITDHIRYEHAKQLIHVDRTYEEISPDGDLLHKVLPFKLRYVFRFEMQALLEKNGFTVTKVYGDFDGRPYDYHSGEMIFTARKLMRYG